jgi:hypothetical protein
MQIIVHAEHLKLPVVFSKVCLAQTIFSFICSVLYIIVCSLSLFATYIDLQSSLACIDLNSETLTDGE